MDRLVSQRAATAMRRAPAEGAPWPLSIAGVPPHLDAVGAALVDDVRVVEACRVAGRSLADEGVALGEALAGLCHLTRRIRRRDPVYEESHALALAWSEATLAFLHRLSCSDPLTGLVTHAHLRERISEICREADHPPHALVVVQAALPRPGDRFTDARALALLGGTARAVFAGAEAIGQVGVDRLVVLAHRDERLGGRVSLLERMVGHSAVQVSLETLPDTDHDAVEVLDRLARGV